MWINLRSAQGGGRITLGESTTTKSCLAKMIGTETEGTAVIIRTKTKSILATSKSTMTTTCIVAITRSTTTLKSHTSMGSKP